MTKRQNLRPAKLTASKPRSKYIAKEVLQGMKLYGKPKCPWCGNSLIFLYGELPRGTLSLRCSNCHKTALVEIETGETVQVIGG